MGREVVKQDWANKRIPAWKQSTMAERFVDCTRMLTVHGLLSEGERDRVMQRLRKELKRQVAP